MLFGGDDIGTGRFLRLLLALLLLLAAVAPSLAQVTTAESRRAHRVKGVTAWALVFNMQRYPLAGDHGAAFANIRPDYRLSVDTVTSGALCRPNAVGVRINFVITLPEATQRARMSPAVRRAWDNFVDFAERHEMRHRQSYIGCAKSFVSDAMRERGQSCAAVESVIRRKFERAKRDCEARQASFDRAQRGAVARLTLFRMAGY
jgi:predicted secreted Zn-dependent protease